MTSNRPYTHQQLKTLLQSSIQQVEEKLPTIPYQSSDKELSFIVECDGVCLRIGNSIYVEEEVIKIIEVLANFYGSGKE